jgi:hypothetical protein
MPRFHRYDELVSKEPTPVNDILWLAGRIAELPPFVARTAVFCGSVAWGKPSWRSDIDIAVFRTDRFTDIGPDVEMILQEYEKSTQGRYLMPKVDVILVGIESERLVTRENLVTGSMPITSKQTVQEIFAATSLRFYDHIGSLAMAKGEPWWSFHKTYLKRVQRDGKTRRNMIRKYVTSFTNTWRRQPLRSLMLNPSGLPETNQLEAMGFAENFPFHLMRQILGERSIYPKPDRADDIKAAFAELSDRGARKVRETLEPFIKIEPTYTSLVADLRRPAGTILAEEFHSRLVALFDSLPFTDVEEVVWDFVSAKKPRRGKRWT